MKLLTSTVALIFLMMSAGLHATARVNVAHFAPFADTIDGTLVDIWVNGELALEDIPYKASTGYLDFEPGTVTIDIALAGTTDVVITETFDLTDGVDYTVFASGNVVMQPLELNALVDADGVPGSDSAWLRVYHAAPFAMDIDATAVSIRTVGGDVVAGLSAVPYKGNSDLFEVPANVYDLKVATPDGLMNLIDPLPVDITDGAIIYLYAVGDGVNQPLEIMALPGGEPLPLRRPVDAGTIGWWIIDGQSGVGAILQPIPKENRLTGSWYQYGDLGQAEFFTFDSCLSDVNELGDFECSTPGAFDGYSALTTLYQSSDGGEGQVNTVAVGTVHFMIHNCTDATAEVIVGEGEPIVYDASRLTSPIGCTLPEMPDEAL